MNKEKLLEHNKDVFERISIALYQLQDRPDAARELQDALGILREQENEINK